MCLIAVALDANDRYPIILIANRDEVHARPTRPLHRWQDPANVIAGRDLQGGGTWMGVTTNGRIAALTNYREPALAKAGAPSRGELVTQFLTADEEPGGWRPETDIDRYAGFNLLVGSSLGEFFYWSNRQAPAVLRKGVHGLSNGELNCHWPKVSGLTDSLSELCASDDVTVDRLFSLLRDKQQPPDEALPSTGIDLSLERLLSPRCIVSPDYGTRAQTVLLVDSDRNITLIERNLDAKGKRVEERREFIAAISDAL